MKVWIDGKVIPENRATVPALDPAVQIGSGLFEVMRAYDGAPLLLDRHLARMRRSARMFNFRLPHGDLTLKRGVIALLRANRLRNAYVRLALTGGGTFMIRAEPLPRVPAAWYRQGAAVDFASWRRDPAAPLYGHKTLNYLENVMTLALARSRGFADYIFLSMDGSVLEGCVTNVFVVSRGHVRTPNLVGVLPGVTREQVLILAASLGLRAEERNLVPRDLERADEVFLTNALIEVLPISRVGTRRIGPPGPITRSLMAAYRRLSFSTIRGR
jgi:branched-subunit amino acid aminotransferase/4-amino-4-deoxychorismate lyase